MNHKEKNEIFGQKPGGYTFIKRQINKIKGWELRFYPDEDLWGVTLGFFPSKLEATKFLLKHRANRGQRGTI